MKPTKVILLYYFYPILSICALFLRLGFCYLNFQACALLPYIGKTFVVRISSFPTDDFTGSDLPVEYAYSFTYDLIPQAPTALTLGQDTQNIIDLDVQQYQHFSVDIPATSVGTSTFII